MVVMMVPVVLFGEGGHCGAQQQCSGQNGDKRFLQGNSSSGRLSASNPILAQPELLVLILK